MTFESLMAYVGRPLIKIVVLLVIMARAWPIRCWSSAGCWASSSRAWARTA